MSGRGKSEVQRRLPHAVLGVDIHLRAPESTEPPPVTAWGIAKVRTSGPPSATVTGPPGRVVWTPRQEDANTWRGRIEAGLREHAGAALCALHLFTFGFPG